MDITTAKAFLLTLSGVVGAILGAIFGEMTPIFYGLLALMLLDYASGLIVAGVYKKSPKSQDGKLDSRAGIKGLIAKGGILAVLIVARVLDLTMGTDFILSGAVVAFIANESISIVENYALTGRPVPEVIYRALTQRNSTDEKHKEP